MKTEDVKDWLQEIAVLEEELQERKKSLPAHSIRPHQLLAVEELEEKIQSLRGKMESAGRKNPQEPS